MSNETANVDVNKILLKSIKESVDVKQINKSKRNLANTEFKQKLVPNFLYLLFLSTHYKNKKQFLIYSMYS